ncbi:MAG TPA: flagellar motor switch protein FliM [Burkholderiaceae bacterium]|nr:flagellar motor switch protein FliM [Burkholderiaceae bacterium]
MADQFLSQDEVDALLEGVSGDAPEKTEERQADGVRPYNIASSERIVRGRMPTLEIINERFARNLRIGLFNFMRRNPEVSVGPVKVQKYSDFLRNIVVPTNINLLSVKPLRGNGLAICEPQLVFTIIDSLFGGSGKFHSRIEGRDFSATENRIILRIVEVICEEYGKSWSGVYPLTLEYQRSEMQPQFATIATPSEIVVTTSFSVEIGESGGQIHLCIPYSTLEPIRDTLYSAVQGDSQVSDRRWVNLLTQQIKTAEVEIAANLAHAGATVSDLLALRVGDFIELDLQQTLTANIDNVPVFERRYGTSAGKYAIRIQKILPGPEELMGSNDGN